jgi:hypothetical protein
MEQAFQARAHLDSRDELWFGLFYPLNSSSSYCSGLFRLILSKNEEENENGKSGSNFVLPN